MSRFTVPIALNLSDTGAEEVRRNHDRCIRELQETPAASAEVIQDVALADGVLTTIPHGLGRTPRMVIVSVPRGAAGAGYIVETREGVDRTRALKLTANNYAATIKVDIEVK